MIKQRELILKSIDQHLEMFTEQYLAARTNQNSIPLIEIDLMKKSLQLLYEQINNLQLHSSVQILENEVNNNIIGSNFSALNSKVENEIKVHETENNTPSISMTTRNATINLNFEAKEINESIILPVEQPNEIKNISLDDISVSINKIEIKNEITEELEQEIIINSASIIEPNQMEVREIIHTESMEKPNVEVQQKNKVESKKSINSIGSLFDDNTITVASKYKVQETISDKLSKEQNNITVAEKLSTKAVVDLRKSIGINERFSFINELFDGNQKLFMESIDRINELNEYEEARRILYEDLAGKMNWNISTKPFNDLDELVKRRFNA